MPLIEKPLVSVYMLTYNHGKYVTQALESIVRQATDFPFEIVIGDDYSTDNTRQILLEYQAIYPDKINLLLNEQNIGMTNNTVNVLKACRGEYIAICEGDDYWLSKDKLQKQVDLMKAHPEYAICFHRVKVVYEEGGEDVSNKDQATVSSVEDLIAGKTAIPTCSVLFKNHFKSWVPELLYHTTSSPDYAIHIYNGQFGKIYFINEVMGAYRQHSGGMSVRLKFRTKIEGMIADFKRINRFLDYKYDVFFKQRLASMYKLLFTTCYLEKDRLGMLKYIIPCLRLKGSMPALSYRFLLNAFLENFIPGFRYTKTHLKHFRYC